jgi:hypothetical protein
MTAQLRIVLRVLAPAALAIASLVLAAPSGASEPATQLGPAPLIGPRAPAPPTAAEIASADEARAAVHSRKVKARTTDRRPGGLLEADVTWSGKGPYSGKVYGSFQDLEADGYCVAAYAWRGDGVEPFLNPDGKHACPAGTAVPAYYSYRKRWRVLVRVCLEKHDRLYYCSDWK